MCDDLSTALKTQEELGVEAPKWATTLMNAALRSMKKQRDDFNKHLAESSEQFKALNERLDKITPVMEDAAKWKLLVDLFKFLFGTARRTVTTLVVFWFTLGLIRAEQVLAILEKLI